jgi:3-methyladenine DNA glycosylase AlkD
MYVQRCIRSCTTIFVGRMRVILNDSIAQGILLPMTAHSAISALRALSDPKKALLSKRFFKTAPGDYGYGDRFLGVTVPSTRLVAKRYTSFPLSDVQTLLHNSYHEVRMLGFLILVAQYETGDEHQKERVLLFYLQNLSRANNWDLVDLSAYKILGASLVGKRDQNILRSLSHSTNLWEQRASVVATLALIREHDFRMILRLAKTFCSHPHDLMHKAVGWMLREVGTRNKKTLLGFLDANAKRMPRTMLRYAIEKLSRKERLQYMRQ